MRNKFLIFTILAVTLTFGYIRHVSAQSDGQRRQAAAEAYDRGTAAYLAGNYAQAAQWFETANRMAPAAAALMQAIRAYRNAGNELRAATLALQITIKYPQEPAVTQYGTEVLKELEGRFLRLEVSCGGCTLDLDGTLQEYMIFFTDPDATHSVIAHFDAGDVKQEVTGAAGETRTLTFEPPLPGGAIAGAATGAGSTTEAQPQTETDDSSKTGSGKKLRVIPPVVTFIAIGVTAALGITSAVMGANLIASGSEFDKQYPKSKQEEICAANYPDKSACEKMLKKNADGVDQQKVTNIVIGVTAGVAVITAVGAIFFTDWSKLKKNPEKTSAMLSLMPNGGMLSVKSRF
jgi:hypothetical protein